MTLSAGLKVASTRKVRARRNFLFPRELFTMKQSMEEEKTAKVVKYARRGQWRKLVHALDKGASVNAADKERRSALFFAALNGNKKCLKELLRRGADPNQCVQFLSCRHFIEMNVNPFHSRRTLDGQTACHAVALGGRSPAGGFANLLVYHFRDARLQCSCLEYLVQYGGDLRVQSFSRETPRDIAVRMRKMNIVTLIENYCEWSLVETGHAWIEIE